MTTPSDLRGDLTKADIDDMVAATDNLRDEALIRFQFEVGLRTTELVNLKILHMKPVVGGEGFEVTVHGKAGSRTLRLIKWSNSVEHWLKLHSASNRAESTVWTHRDQSRSLSSSAIQRIFDRTAAQAGIKKRAAPHAVRHACAQRLLEMGMPPRYIRVWLGLQHQGIFSSPPSDEVNQWYERKMDADSEDEGEGRER